jgi:hypothetical protein
MMDKLIEWKDDSYKKPLLLQGIRQCGKTYLLKEFGTRFYKDVLYFDFLEESHLADFFEQNLEPHRIIKDLSIFYGKDIKPDSTLVIFDEIQACGKALESLRYFYSEAPEYHITAAGSFLGVAIPHGFTIPVGSVEALTLYPMNFYEFLLAQNSMLALHLKESAFRGDAYKTFQAQIEERYRDFQIVGGMPEVVQSWVDTKSIETVDRLQKQIIKGYENDFANYAPINLYPKLTAVWNAIPAQLAKENRKFVFSKVKKSWRAKDLEDALYWLVRTGLVYKVEHIEKPGLPLSGYVNHTFFKLYMCDVGLLRRTANFPSSVVLDKSESFREIKGCIAENIVCCELMRIYEQELYYWSAENPGRAEVEFIVQDGSDIIPVEVKAGSASKARSLSQYRMRFAPKKSVLTSMDNDRDDILPLYAFWNLKDWLKK